MGTSSAKAAGVIAAIVSIIVTFVVSFLFPPPWGLVTVLGAVAASAYLSGYAVAALS